jgi:secreted trypsin-like serine protease
MLSCLRIVAYSLVLVGVAHPTFALVGGTVDANTTDSPWAGVVSITPSTGGVFSGALIDSRHVLTAAHVVFNHAANPGNVVVNLNYGGNLTSQISASRISIHPSYTTGNTPSDTTFAWNDDVAVIRLSQPIPIGVPTYPLFTGTPGLNGAPATITMVAYGGFGDGVAASLSAGANASVKRIGSNRVDQLFADDEGSGKAEIFVFDFDGPNATTNVLGGPTLGAGIEAGYASGDSGSPAFVYVNGAYRIAGIGAFNGDPATIPGNSIQFGAIGGGMVVAPYVEWINEQTALPVPEPESYAMMLAGLAFVAYAVRRRARR